MKMRRRVAGSKPDGRAKLGDSSFEIAGLKQPFPGICVECGSLNTGFLLADLFPEAAFGRSPGRISQLTQNRRERGMCSGKIVL